MKLATVRLHGGTRAAVVADDALTLTTFGDVGELLAAAVDWRNPPLDGTEEIPLAGADLAPVVPRPPKIICLGLNYRNHIAEMGREAPPYPTLFAKFPPALVGARDDIVLPRVSDEVDWEVELAFVIGRRARHVPVSQALDVIAGYTVLNDISVRDYQYRTLQWLQGKTFQSTTPVGPWLVTPDEVDHARDLEVRCEVDGEVMQQARTRDLLFPPAEIVSYISAIVELAPGDLIATGTPGGVGHGRDPQVYLRPGQTVRTSIEGIGELVNRCVKEETP